MTRADWADAISRLEKITESEPRFAAPLINLGIAYREANRLEDSIDALERALAVNPRHPVAHNELGISYRRTGRFAEARDAYESALDFYPNFHPARKNLGIVCDLFLSDIDCALRNYRLYRELVATDPDVEIWIADLENRKGN